MPSSACDRDEPQRPAANQVRDLLATRALLSRVAGGEARTRAVRHVPAKLLLESLVLIVRRSRARIPAA